MPSAGAAAVLARGAHSRTTCTAQERLTGSASASVVGASLALEVDSAVALVGGAEDSAAEEVGVTLMGDLPVTRPLAVR